LLNGMLTNYNHDIQILFCGYEELKLAHSGEDSIHLYMNILAGWSTARNYH